MENTPTCPANWFLFVRPCSTASRLDPSEGGFCRLCASWLPSSSSSLLASVMEVPIHGIVDVPLSCAMEVLLPSTMEVSLPSAPANVSPVPEFVNMSHCWWAHQVAWSPPVPGFPLAVWPTSAPISSLRSGWNLHLFLGGGPTIIGSWSPVGGQLHMATTCSTPVSLHLQVSCVQGQCVSTERIATSILYLITFAFNKARRKERFCNHSYYLCRYKHLVLRLLLHFCQTDGPCVKIKL